MLGRTECPPEEEWETAIEEAILLVTERNPPGDGVDYKRKRNIRKEKMDGLSWLASDKAVDMLETFQRYAKTFTKSKLPLMPTLADEALSESAVAIDTMKKLHLHAKMVNAVYATLANAIKTVNQPPFKETPKEKQMYDPVKQKLAKDKLEELGIIVQPERVHKPEELEEQALNYYSIVFPEMHKSWRGLFAGQKFNF